MVFADSTQYDSIKLTGVTGTSREYILTGALQKTQIQIAIQLLWNAFGIKWSLLLPKLHNNEVNLSILVTMKLSLTLCYLLVSHGRQDPHEPNNIAKQYINHSI